MPSRTSNHPSNGVVERGEKKTRNSGCGDYGALLENNSHHCHWLVRSRRRANNWVFPSGISSPDVIASSSWLEEEQSPFFTSEVHSSIPIRLFEQVSIGFIDFFTLSYAPILIRLISIVVPTPVLDRSCSSVVLAQQPFVLYMKTIMDTDHGLVQRAVHFQQRDAPF